MRGLARKLVPQPALRLARRLRDAAAWRRRIRRTPRLVRFQGDGESVLQGVLAYNEHGGYCVPLASLHRPAAQSILAGDVWERDTLRFLSSRVGGGDVVHAGTYFGDFLPALSRSRAAGAKVWAFEPNPESYRCARITAEINQLRNVELANAGLGERGGRLLMETADAGGRSLGGASRIVHEARDAPSAALATVDVVALDEVLPPDRRVSIIQLDVEGFEQQALSGALGTIRRCQPDLVLETLPGEAWLAENLWTLGYRLAGRLDANAVLSISSPR